MRLHEIAKQLGYSRATVLKAVLKHASLTFREYQKERLLEAGIAYLREGYKAREIGSLLGYRWSENFLRAVKRSAGCSLRELNQNDGLLKGKRSNDNKLAAEVTMRAND